MTARFLASLAIVLTSGVLSAGTETDWQNNRLIALQKITVGPWDNFEVSVTPDDRSIYFTRDQNQVSNIYQQQLPAVATEQFIGQHGDAKQPTLSPDQSQLAFIYYAHDAQGDLCVVTLGQTDIRCLTGPGSAENEPFWISANELGYLRRKGIDPKQSLMSYSLDTGEQQIEYSGAISAPSIAANGRYFLFNLSTGQQVGETQLSVFDRQTKQLIQPPKVDLPGITGTHTLSLDGKQIYFSHYLNDTNGDQIIDGNDHSVLFRMPLQTWLNSTSALLPEQLTAVDHNCKFPSVSQSYLYLTCAFEGSLDIYRLPLDGVVPKHWNEAQLLEAHQAVRSYEDRLLLINTLRYRLKKNDRDLLERLLSNHLEIGEVQAARYYLDQLAERYQDDRPDVAALYLVLSQLMHVRAAKQRVPVGIVTARFSRQVADARKKMNQGQRPPYLRHYLNAYLDYELDKPDTALATLSQIDLDQTMLPLAHYLIFDLFTQLLEKQDPERLLDLYPSMFRSAELNNDARLYYAFRYLKHLEQGQTNPQKRAAQIARLQQETLPTEVTALFEAEQAILLLLSASGNTAQNKAYKQLNKVLKKYRTQPQLRKAQHIRAITQLGEAELFKFMELLSRHWLLTTHISEMEFVNTAEQYSIITLDKAYGIMADQQLVKAYNTFYSAIRQTNDLEAHFHFVILGLNPALGMQDNLKQAYEQFEKQDLIGDSRYYVSALRYVLEAQAQPKQAEKLWDQALADLALVSFGGINPAMRDLLMGYIYHQKLQRSKIGYSYDEQAYQKAHYHYMMALDLGRDNQRISASIYENMAWLQFDVAQYAYAADLFSQRMQLPFSSDEAKLRSLWGSARAAFYANQADTAWQQGEKAFDLAQQLNTDPITPYREKAAFYAMQAEQYRRAIEHYQQLFEDNALSGHNRAKAQLAYAYALIKEGDEKAARQQLSELLKSSSQLKTKASDNQRLLALNIQRQQLLAHGFLANMANTDKERIHHLNQRINILKTLEKNAESFGYTDIERTAFLAKDYLKLAVAYENNKQFNDMKNATFNALKTAIQWAEESGDDAGPVITQTLLNVSSLAILHPGIFSKEFSKQLAEQMQKTLKAYEQIPYQSEAVVAEYEKLKHLTVY